MIWTAEPTGSLGLHTTENQSSYTPIINSPMTTAVTFSPLLITASRPATCAGRCTNPFAPHERATREDRWPPVDRAVSVPGLEVEIPMNTRWNSSRGSRDMSSKSCDRNQHGRRRRMTTRYCSPPLVLSAAATASRASLLVLATAARQRGRT